VSDEKGGAGKVGRKWLKRDSIVFFLIVLGFVGIIVQAFTGFTVL